MNRLPRRWASPPQQPTTIGLTHGHGFALSFWVSPLPDKQTRGASELRASARGWEAAHSRANLKNVWVICFGISHWIKEGGCAAPSREPHHGHQGIHRRNHFPSGSQD